MRERWGSVPGYEGAYESSTSGRVRTVTRQIRKWDGVRTIKGKILKQRRDKAGYLFVKLSRNGRGRPTGVHRIVLLTFVGPCPPGMQCRHLNGDPADNRLENLCWGTPAENAGDRIRHGTQPVGERQGAAKIRDADVPVIHRRYDAGETCEQIGDSYGVSSMAVKFVLHGKTFKHCQPAVRAKIRPSGFQKGNNAKGKLTPEMREAAVAARAAGESYTAISKHLGVHYTTVWSFLNNKSYR